jgi:outer membrane protein
VGRETVDPGLSTVLVTDDGWRLSSSLQITDQREADDDPLLRGLPDVRMTLRGRATATIALGERWSANFTGSQDLLGRDGGLQLGTGLGYHHPVSEQTYWDASLGAGWANALSRQTQFGISTETALATGRPAYLLGSGWDSVSLGWNITSALNRRWVVFGGLSVSQLQGAAARSPLVGHKTTYGASLGLAYRSR